MAEEYEAPYAAPPPPPPRRRNTPLIIGIIFVVLLVCCCAILAVAYFLGDPILQFFEGMSALGRFLPA